MSERLSIEAGETRLDRRPLSLWVRFHPFSLTLERAGATVLSELTFWAAAGVTQDRFLQSTEGVIAAEQLEAPELVERVDGGTASAAELELGGTLTGGGRRFCLRVRIDPECVAIAFEVAGEALRLGARWAAVPGERFVGLGANHGHRLDQSGRRVRLGADRRYTGPDCPPDLLEVGGVRDAPGCAESTYPSLPCVPPLSRRRRLLACELSGHAPKPEDRVGDREVDDAPSTIVGVFARP